MDSTPPEVWLEIFKLLPKPSLSSIVATCRTFAQLARPLLFATFVFEPYGDDLVGDGSVGDNQLQLYLPPHEKRPFIEERFEFWTSTAIAPFVRFCSVGTWDVDERPDGIAVNSDLALILLDTFLDRIPNFTRLRSLSLYDIKLTSHATSRIFHSLPNLGELDILLQFLPNPDSFSANAPGPALSKFSLVLDNFYEDDGLHPYIPFLNPTHLRELNLQCLFHSWSAHPEIIPVFPHVGRLSIHNESMSDIVHQRFAALLPKFPAVEHLTITGHLDVKEQVAGLAAGCQALLSGLKRVDIAQGLVTVFIPHATRLEDLTISYAKSEELLALLRTKKTYTVTSLHVDFDWDRAEPGTLERILESFPRLQHLRVNNRVVGLETEEEATIATAFLKTLSAQAPDSRILMPSMLTTLMLAWSLRYHGVERRDTPRHAPIDLAATREALVALNPSLTSLWLDGTTFLLKWRRRMSDGYVSQQAYCDDYDAAKVVRVHAEGFWNSARLGNGLSL
ncbi:hypothetical protein C8F01DRAFT_1230879 [Mycena amicta]|nr:hypothetical protein C8F01DRAFT_1230879 [Mycena amicta]